MNYLLIILCFISFSVQKSGVPLNVQIPEKKPSEICPVESPKARQIIEDFISNPKFEFHRNQTEITHLNVSDIELLSDNNQSDSIICEELTNEGYYDNIFHNTYYKAGNYYLLVYEFKPFDDDDLVIMGGSNDVIYVLDSNMDKIAGFIVNN